MHDAVLVLEDGRAFFGRRFGAPVDAAGEVVFNTCMAGYQELLSDPSYRRQILVLTATQVGNCGIVPEDEESGQVQAAALVVKDLSTTVSNWRAKLSLADHLTAHRVPGLMGLDTRALVRHLREAGALKGVLAAATADLTSLAARARALPDMAGLDLTAEVASPAPYAWETPSPSLERRARPRPPARRHVVVLDYGVKRNILRRLVDEGCRVTVMPGGATAAAVLAARPDGVLLSNGPGDPAACTGPLATVRALVGRLPLLGICLGHQLLCLAVGARSFKLKFGHHGGNHPVKACASGRVLICAHNHGFAVDPASLPAGAEVTHVSLNDHTLEGVAMPGARALGLQFHPEAAPGPHDAAPYFRQFTELMDAR